MATYTFGLTVKAPAVKAGRQGMIPCPAHGTDGHPVGCGQLESGGYPVKDGTVTFRPAPAEYRDRDRVGAHFWYSPEALAMHLTRTFAGSDADIAAEVNRYMASLKDDRRIRATDTTVRGEHRFAAK